MDIRNLPPLVDWPEVEKLQAELDHVVSGEALFLSVDPICPRRFLEPNEATMRERLTLLLRIAAYASYVCSARIAKVANLGHSWDASDAMLSSYLRTVSAANYVSVLARGGYSSLARFDEWSRPRAFPAPESYVAACDRIRRAMTFQSAMSIPFGSETAQLDLWHSVDTAPTRSEDLFLCRTTATGRRYLSTAHLVEFGDSWQRAPERLSDSMLALASPISVSLSADSDEQHLVDILRLRDADGLITLVRIPATSAPTGSTVEALAEMRHALPILEVEVADGNVEETPAIPKLVYGDTSVRWAGMSMAVPEEMLGELPLWAPVGALQSLLADQILGR